MAKSSAAEEAPTRTLSLKGRAGSNPAPGRLGYFFVTFPYVVHYECGLLGLFLTPQMFE